LSVLLMRVCPLVVAVLLVVYLTAGHSRLFVTSSATGELFTDKAKFPSNARHALPRNVRNASHATSASIGYCCVMAVASAAFVVHCLAFTAYTVRYIFCVRCVGCIIVTVNSHDKMYTTEIAYYTN